MIQVPREPLNREAPGRLPKLPHKARERSSYAGVPSNLVVAPKTLPRLRLIDLIRADPDHFESCTLHLVFAQLQVQELNLGWRVLILGCLRKIVPSGVFLRNHIQGVLQNASQFPLST